MRSWNSAVNKEMRRSLSSRSIWRNSLGDEPSELPKTVSFSLMPPLPFFSSHTREFLLFVSALVKSQARLLPSSQHVGVDGIYKLTKFSWPIWIIVVEDNGGHSWIIGVIAASAES